MSFFSVNKKYSSSTYLYRIMSVDCRVYFWPDFSAFTVHFKKGILKKNDIQPQKSLFISTKYTNFIGIYCARK